MTYAKCNKQFKNEIKKAIPGNSLVVQWLGLHTLTAEGLGSIPGQGTKIPQAAQQKKKKEKERKKAIL